MVSDKHRKELGFGTSRYYVRVLRDKHMKELHSFQSIMIKISRSVGWLIWFLMFIINFDSME